MAGPSCQFCSTSSIVSSHSTRHYCYVFHSPFKSYNSAIFDVFAGQDYIIRVVRSDDEAALRVLQKTTHNLTNKWETLYNTKYVPNAGDLYLVTDQISFSLNFNQNYTSWHLVAADADTNDEWTAIDWPFSSLAVNMNATVSGPTSTGVVESITVGNQRVCVPYQDYTLPGMPNVTLPAPIVANTSRVNSWKDLLSLNRHSWMSSFHIREGLSKPLPNSNSIQMALSFMVIVVVCNALKVIAIYYTLKDSFSGNLVTQGDAISSFLESPDMTTIGFCTLEKGDLVSKLRKLDGSDPAPWLSRVRPYSRETGGRWMSNLYL